MKYLLLSFVFRSHGTGSVCSPYRTSARRVGWRRLSRRSRGEPSVPSEEGCLSVPNPDRTLKPRPKGLLHRKLDQIFLCVTQLPSCTASYVGPVPGLPHFSVSVYNPRVSYKRLICLFMYRSLSLPPLLIATTISYSVKERYRTQTGRQKDGRERIKGFDLFDPS